MALLVCDQGILGLFETGATDEEGTNREIFESAFVRELNGLLPAPIGVDINPHPRLCCDGEPNRRVHTRRISHPPNPSIHRAFSPRIRDSHSMPDAPPVSTKVVL